MLHLMGVDLGEVSKVVGILLVVRQVDSTGRVLLLKMVRILIPRSCLNTLKISLHPLEEGEEVEEVEEEV